jgi:hypothetical protein
MRVTVALIAMVSFGAQAPASHAAKFKRTLRQVVPIRSDGTVSRDDALKVFAATVAPLPGVKPPKGGYPYIRSASGPIRWVLRNWSKLTPAQRAAVQKELPDIAVPGAKKTGPSARAAKLTVADIQVFAEQGRAVLNKYFNPDLTMPVVIDTDKVWKELDAGAYATISGGCRVAFPTSVANEDPKYVREILLHELTHCYMFQLSPDPGELPPWVAEGAAQWVMAVVSRDPAWLGPGYVSPIIQDDWKTYLTNFTAPLTQHAYSAMGYYAQLAYSYNQAQVFQTITSMFQASSGAQAYQQFTGGPSFALQFVNTLAPSGTRLKTLGPRWETNGPSIPSVTKARYNPPSAAVGAGTLNVTASAYGRRVLGLNPVKGAETVKLDVATPATAFGLLHYEDGDHSLQGGKAYFCARKSCKCPDGREIQPLGDDSYIGLYAHRKQANVRLIGTKLSEACAQSPSALTISGAFTATVTEQGACSLKSSEMGSKPFDALIGTGYSPQRPQGLGQVQIFAGGAGPGTYQSDIDKPPPYGHARVTKFGEPAGNAWRDFNPVGADPIVRKFGSVTVTSVSGDGASGTVEMQLFAEPPASKSQVTLKGRWSCVPFDKFLGSKL